MAVVEEQGGRPATGTGTAGIVFDTAGEGDPPMLFLHGWCGDRSFFAPQFDHFSRSHWVVGLDLPGHGESRAPAAYSIGGLAADVAVEPAAGDRVEDNFNPVGRVYYGFSTLLCIPASLSQAVGLALGAQAGEARIRDVVASAGLNCFRRVSETPFNLVFEALP